MAIIQCPHCGKNISDKAWRCIHCGESVTGEEAPKPKVIDYDSISYSYKNALKKEFYEVYPKYKKYENKESMLKKLYKVKWILTILGVVACIPLIIFGNQEGIDLKTAEIVLVVGILGIMLITASQVLNIFSRFFLRYYKKKTLLATKKYQKWLKDEKGITYYVTFIGKDAKWKKYFDDINVDLEG